MMSNRGYTRGYRSRTGSTASISEEPGSSMCSMSSTSRRASTSEEQGSSMSSTSRRASMTEESGSSMCSMSSMSRRSSMSEEPGSELKTLYSVFDEILELDKTHLLDVISHRKDANRESQLAARELNNLGRRNYAKFVEDVGSNIFPFIIASDHDDFAGVGSIKSGVGTTFSLFLEDGSEYKMTPSLWSNYEIYKATCHGFLAISTILGPFLKNPGSTAWHQPLAEYEKQLQATKAAIEACDIKKITERESVLTILTNQIKFCQTCLSEKTFSFEQWTAFNHGYFPDVQRCMVQATQIQAENALKELLKWKAMLGPALWRKLYVIIPTVWAVGETNPRLEIFRNLMDPDRARTHIFMSDYPRSLKDIKKLLGIIVADRAIGRFVFGDQTLAQKMKVVGLSTKVDVVQDTAVPNIQKAAIKLGLTPAPFLKFSNNEPTTNGTDNSLSTAKGVSTKQPTDNGVNNKQPTTNGNDNNQNTVNGVTNNHLTTNGADKNQPTSNGMINSQLTANGCPFKLAVQRGVL